MAAVAGQAVGPALSGSIIGSAGLVVEQAVALDTDFEILDSGFDDFIGMMNDDGTFFTIGIETKVGQIGKFAVPLNNLTDTDAHAILHLIVSPGFDVDVDSDIGVDETIQRPIVWLSSGCCRSPRTAATSTSPSKARIRPFPVFTLSVAAFFRLNSCRS